MLIAASDHANARVPKKQTLPTQAARDFRPVLLSLMAFGNRHFAPEGAMVEVVNTRTGKVADIGVFDRATGRLKYFELNAGGKGSGGSFVVANDSAFFVHTRLKGVREFNLADGLNTAFMPNEPVLDGDLVYSAQTTKEGANVVRAYNAERDVVWEIAADGTGDHVVDPRARRYRRVAAGTPPHGGSRAALREAPCEASAARRGRPRPHVPARGHPALLGGVVWPPLGCFGGRWAGRELARRRLGDRFDIRRFHDAVLLAGPLPMDLLTTRIEAWIKDEAARPAAN